MGNPFGVYGNHHLQNSIAVAKAKKLKSLQKIVDVLERGWLSADAVYAKAVNNGPCVGVETIKKYVRDNAFAEFDLPVETNRYYQLRLKP